jgi:hypothetical protein
MEATKTYRLRYGNGHQLFYVVSISANGKKAGGLRLVGQGTENAHWDPSSIKVDDPRIQCEVLLPVDAPALPVIPAKVSKDDLAALKAAFAAALAAFEVEYEKKVFIPFEGCTNSGTYYVPPEIRAAYNVAGSALKKAKHWNQVHA